MKGIKAVIDSLVNTLFIIGVFLFTTSFIDYIDVTQELNLVIYMFITVSSGFLIYSKNKK